MQQKLADDNPAVAGFRDRLAISHNHLGLPLKGSGQPSEVAAEYRKALAIYQKLADDNPTDTDFRSRLAASHDNVGSLLQDTGKSWAAAVEYRKGWNGGRSWPMTIPDTPEFSREASR